VEAFLQAVEFGIADVGAVEEGDEIEEAEPWDQTEVEFPEEPAVLGSLSDPCIPEQCADVIFDRIQCAPSPPRSGQRLDLGEAVHGRGSRSRLPRRRPLSPYRRPGSERYRCRFALSTASLWQSVATLSEKGSDEGGTKGRDGRWIWPNRLHGEHSTSLRSEPIVTWCCRPISISPHIPHHCRLGVVMHQSDSPSHKCRISQRQARAAPVPLSMPCHAVCM